MTNNLELLLQGLKNISGLENKEQIYADYITHLARWIQNIENEQKLDKKELHDKINKLDDDIESKFSKLTNAVDKLLVVVNGFSDNDKNSLINKISSLETELVELREIIDSLKAFRWQILGGFAALMFFVEVAIKFIFK